MRRTARIGAALALLTTALAAVVGAPSPATAQEAPAVCGTAFPAYDRDPVATSATTQTDVEIEMSDGVVLRADVSLPDGLPGPFPTSLTITGYNKSAGAAFLGAAGGDLTDHGYAVVTVDDRGTGSSGGMWDSWGERTRADYVEVLDWIVAQPWSNGRVGVTGASYMGITSLFTAATGHPAVDGVFAIVPMGDAYRDIVFQGGQVNVSFIPLWMGLVTGLGALPSDDPTTVVDHLLGITQFQLPSIAESVAGGGTAFDGPFWRQRSPLEVADDIEAPTFIVGGHHDLFQRGEPMLYEALADHTDARLLMGPWTHISAGSGLPAGGVPAVSSLQLQWFDTHVMDLDTGAECIPPVTQYVLGAEEYRTGPSWPLPDLHAERWHLRGDESLTRETPGDEGSRQYLQLPINGICTRSASQWLAGALEGTPCMEDNSLDESLALTWTTPPFAEPVRIDGPLQADLWLRTLLGSEAMTSVAVSLVSPDGTSRGISNGQLLLSHRAVDPGLARVLDGQSIQPWHPFTQEAAQPVPSGEPVLAQVEIFPTSLEIPAGSRLRVTVAAYDVPHALPPAPAALSTAAGPVEVLHDAAHPSSIVLPVIGAESVTVPDGPTPPAPAPEATPDAGGSGSLPATGGSTRNVAASVLFALAVVVWCARRRIATN